MLGLQSRTLATRGAVTHLQGPLMIWLFERGDEVVRLETRIDEATKEYVVAIAWADRPDAVERYGDLSLFRARILALESTLAAEHWSQTADSPTLLADVWRGPFSS
jgi:hypothetical protein